MLNGLKPGTIIDGRFRLMDEIGRGGMGVVYRAMHLSINKQVAVKILRQDCASDSKKMQRFRREAHVISVLEHPNIVHIFSVGMVEAGQPYIAMEFLPGEQLSQQIERRGAIPWTEALPLFIQICDAMQHAHEQQVIHRDVKPSNIVVGKDDAGNASAKLVDFGIAKFIADRSAAITQTDAVVGSVSYTSPEQFEGKQADVGSDIYSLGCTIYQALTGKLPCVGDTVFETVNSHLNTEPEPINQANPSASVPSDLNYLVQRMLRKNGAERPESALEIRHQLTQILASEKIQRSAFPDSKPRKNVTASLILKSKVLTVLLGVGVALAIVSALSTRLPDKLFQSKPLNATGDRNEPTILLRINESVKGSSGNAHNVYELGYMYDPSKNDFPARGLTARVNEFNLTSQILYERAYALAEKLDNTVLAAEIGENLASSYARTGRVEDAIRLDLSTITKARRVQYRVFPLRLNLMKLYASIGDYNAANEMIPVILPAIEYGRKSADEVSTAYSTSIVVKSALGEKEEVKQLESAFQIALPCHAPVDCKTAEAFALMKSGNRVLASQRYKELTDILAAKKNHNLPEELSSERELLRVLTEWLSVSDKGERAQVAERQAASKKRFDQLFKTLNDRTGIVLPI